LKTYSIGFEGALEDSEHQVAGAFARHIGAEHHEEIISPDVGGFLENYGRLLDEPNADTSCLPTYYLSRFARRHVTVAI
jgi:asparagine synthase (glutamine-hydrolysing)